MPETNKRELIIATATTLLAAHQAINYPSDPGWWGGQSNDHRWAKADAAVYSAQIMVDDVEHAIAVDNLSILNDAVGEIDRFLTACSEAEYMDTGRASTLLEDLRGQLRQVAKGATSDGT